MNTPFSYEVIRRKGQKNIYLRIRNDGSVVVSAPAKMSLSTIEEFVYSKASWVEKHLDRFKTYAKRDPIDWTKGVKVWYLGRLYEVDKTIGSQNCIQIQADKLLFVCNDEGGWEKALGRFYHRQASLVIPPRVKQWQEKMGVSPKKILLRSYKSFWGCCKNDGTILFNTRLMRYEPRLIDYVIVHELAHLRYRNHGVSFWRMVERFVPEWKVLRKKLI